jgi:hypothetical protein
MLKLSSLFDKNWTIKVKNTFVNILFLEYYTIKLKSNPVLSFVVMVKFNGYYTI